MRDRQFHAIGSSARSAMLMREGVRLELREYAHPAPRQQTGDAPAVDHGINHFCFAVDDAHAEYARLLAAGMTFDCEPLEVLLDALNAVRTHWARAQDALRELDD